MSSKLSRPLKPSIWGNADLKALAREAAAEAEQLFAPIEISRNDLSEVGGTTDPGANIPTVRVRNDDPPEGTPQIVLRTRDNDAEIEPTTVDRAEPSATKSALAPLGFAVRHNRGRQRKTTAISHAERNDSHIIDNELLRLTEENRRLQSVLKDRLLAENAQLQEMLKRYQAGL